MEPPEELARLLASEEAAWDRILAPLLQVPPDQMDTPGACGGWTGLETLWHLAFWQEQGAKYLERLARGEVVGGPPRTGELEEVNEAARLSLPDLSLSEMRREVAAARKRLREAVLALPEQVLEGDSRAREAFLRCGELHYLEHLGELEAWASRLGGGDPR